MSSGTVQPSSLGLGTNQDSLLLLFLVCRTVTKSVLSFVWKDSLFSRR